MRPEKAPQKISTVTFLHHSKDKQSAKEIWDYMKALRLEAKGLINFQMLEVDTGSCTAYTPGSTPFEEITSATILSNPTEIKQALESSNYVMLGHSVNAVNDTTYLAFVDNPQTRVVPIRLDNAEMPQKIKTLRSLPTLDGVYKKDLAAEIIAEVRGVIADLTPSQDRPR